MATPKYAYLITNRAHILGHFEDKVGKSLTFLRAPAGTSDFSITLYEEWLSSLRKDIADTASGSVGQAMLFVHGYAVDFDKAKALFGDFLDNLGKLGGYPGPVVEFDWPSNGIVALSDLLPTSFSKAKERARETGAMFDQLAKVLTDIHKTRHFDASVQGVSSVNLSVVCHSMGNYAMQQGASLLPTGPDRVVDQMLLVASMLATDSFDPSGDSATPAGDIMAATIGQVTAYYTRYDDVLPFASLPIKGLDEYPELGVTGPLYVPVPPQPLYPGFSAMDCTSIVTPAAAKQYGAPKVHEAYFYIPQMVQTLVAAAVAIPSAAPAR
jgi:esterase/lipase superfamily enzyme